MRLIKYINETKINVSEPEEVIDILRKDCMPFITELKRTGFKDNFFYRGHGYAEGMITKKRIRDNRRPKDMGPETSDFLDWAFKKKFGWAARSNGIFATSKPKDAMQYGEPFIFFPIGKYKYIWSPGVPDLYSEIDNNKLHLDNIDETSAEKYFDLEYAGELEGHWEYDGVELDTNSGKKLDAIEAVEDDMELFGIEYRHQIDHNMFEFIPDQTGEEFLQDFANSVENELKDLVSTYKNKDLKSALRIGNEITFNCKEYYLVIQSLDKVLAHDFF